MNLALHLEEVLKLVAETGDRCIVVTDDQAPFVVMDLSQYRTLLKAAAGKERIGKLSESELLEKINQDIAEWREARQEDLTEYDLSQFRIDSPVRAQKTQEYSKQRRMTERMVPNLPVVDEDEPSDARSEFRLEPSE